MTAFALACLLQVWEPPPPPGSGTPQAFRPAHQGFTISLELGIGDALIGSSRGRGGTSGIGLGGLNALFGWFLNHDVDVAFKLDLYNSDIGNYAAFGPVLQYWLGDDFTVIGGIGLGTGNNLISNGFAFILGATWNAWKPAPQHAIGAYFDVTPIISDPTVVILQGGIGWQFF
jgi:hypothetical protein